MFWIQGETDLIKSHNLDTIRKFYSETELWIPDTVEIVISYLIEKQSKTNEQRLLNAAISLVSIPSLASGKSIKYDSKSFIAGIQSIPMNGSELDQYLEKLFQDPGITIEEIHYPMPNAGEINAYHESFYFQGNSPPAGTLQTKLSLSGSGYSDIAQGVFGSALIDWELRGWDSPFDNLQEFLAHIGLGHLRSESGFDGKCQISLQVGPPVVFDRSSCFVAGGFLGKVICGDAVETGEIEIGYRAYGEQTQAAYVDITTFVIEDKGGHKELSFKIRIPDSVYVFVYLKYKREVADKIVIVNPDKTLNIDSSIHSIFDERHEILRMFLKGEGAHQGNDFEQGVQLLLTMSGFRVAAYGTSKKFSHAPDLIAVTPGGNTLVIECTTGVVDSEKLQHLHSRVIDIRRKLVGDNVMTDVLAALFSCKSKESFIGISGQAADMEIALVADESLNLALEALLLPPNADSFFDEIRKLIPKKPRPDG